MTKNKTNRRRFNLLQAEVYVRYPVCTVGDKVCRKYAELREEVVGNGVVETLVEQDYPITPESVNSYAESADYKKNPEVVTKATPRQNLGDVTELQQVLRNDMTAMREMMMKSQEVLEKMQQVQATQKAVAQSEKTEVEENVEKV